MHNNIITFFITTGNDQAVINAEVLCADFLVEHNLPLAVADHMGPLFKKMFPDSKISGMRRWQVLLFF